MERESFVFYRSFFDAVETLEDGDKILFYQMIARYALDGVLPDACRSPAYGMFLLVKPQIDANARRYENGKRGGRKPKANQTESKQEPKVNQTESKQEPNVNVNDNDNDNVNVNGSRAKPTRFWAREKKPEKKPGKYVNYEQRETDYDALFGIGG